MKRGIPKLAKTERLKWIEALKELLLYYKDESKKMSGCSLCDVSVTSTRGKCTTNSYCPWYWFIGISCNSFSIKNFHKTAWDLREQRNPKWVKIRADQIPQWTKELEAGL